MTYPVTDLVQVTIQPLYCRLDSDFDLSTNSPQIAFEAMCEPNLNNKPIVHVLDNHSYFNITNSLTVEGLEFRGEN